MRHLEFPEMKAEVVVVALLRDPSKEKSVIVNPCLHFTTLARFCCAKILN